jgi:ribulose-phosphate 3-epimerase
MSIHPGYSGQPFREETYGRVERLRAVLPHSVHIQVDGGVGEDNIGGLHDRGASLFVGGSSIFSRDNFVVAYQRLVEALA